VVENDEKFLSMKMKRNVHITTHILTLAQAYTTVQKHWHIRWCHWCRFLKRIRNRESFPVYHTLHSDSRAAIWLNGCSLGQAQRHSRRQASALCCDRSPASTERAKSIDHVFEMRIVSRDSLWLADGDCDSRWRKKQAKTR